VLPLVTATAAAAAATNCWAEGNEDEPLVEDAGTTLVVGTRGMLPFPVGGDAFRFEDALRIPKFRRGKKC